MKFNLICSWKRSNVKVYYYNVDLLCLNWKLERKESTSIVYFIVFLMNPFELSKASLNVCLNESDRPDFISWTNTTDSSFSELKTNTQQHGQVPSLVCPLCGVLFQCHVHGEWTHDSVMIQTRWTSAGSGIFNTTWKQSFCNLVTNKMKTRMF